MHFYSLRLSVANGKPLRHGRAVPPPLQVVEVDWLQLFIPPIFIVEVMVCSFSYLPCLQGCGLPAATSKRSLEAPTEAGAETVAERSEVGGVIITHYALSIKHLKCSPNLNVEEHFVLQFI